MNFLQTMNVRPNLQTEQRNRPDRLDIGLSELGRLRRWVLDGLHLS